MGGSCHTCVMYGWEGCHMGDAGGCRVMTWGCRRWGEQKAHRIELDG